VLYERWGYDCWSVNARGRGEEVVMEGAARQSPRSPSSDGDYSSEDEDSNSVLPGSRNRRPMHPMPQSHWFPRSISFGPYVRLRPRNGTNAPPRGARQHARLHIQVTRPVHSSPRLYRFLLCVFAASAGVWCVAFCNSLEVVLYYHSIGYW